MHPTMRLYEDVLSSAENVEFRLPPLPRFIFIVHGSARVAGATLNEGEAWQGEAAVTVKPGSGGVTCWRWELTRGDRRHWLEPTLVLSHPHNVRFTSKSGHLRCNSPCLLWANSGHHRL